MCHGPEPSAILVSFIFVSRTLGETLHSSAGGAIARGSTAAGKLSFDVNRGAGPDAATPEFGSISLERRISAGTSILADSFFAGFCSGDNIADIRGSVRGGGGTGTTATAGVSFFAGA